MKVLVIPALLAALVASTLSAQACLRNTVPGDLVRVEDALKSVKLSAAKRDKARTLHDEAAALNRAGKWYQARSPLREAMRILGVKEEVSMLKGSPMRGCG